MRILGVNRRGHPSQYHPNGLFEYKVVLWDTESGASDAIRASIGQGDPEWVALRGDPISFYEAKVHFPTIGEEVEKRWGQ